MKPDDIIKYIFEEERQDYQSRTLKSRKKELVQARQRSMYLLKHFFPSMIWEEVGNYFEQHHDGAIHAYNKVTNYIATEKQYEKEIAKYITVIRGRMSRKLRVNCTSVTCKMDNKRAILHKTDQGYMILLKRLSGRKVEKKFIVLSDEAMEGIIQSYSILNK